MGEWLDRWIGGWIDGWVDGRMAPGIYGLIG